MLNGIKKTLLKGYYAASGRLDLGSLKIEMGAMITEKKGMNAIHGGMAGLRLSSKS